MISYNVAVTGLNAMDDPSAGIPVIRSIRLSKEWVGKIIGLTYDALDTGIYDSDLIDEVYLLPYATEGEGALLQRLKQINNKTPLHVIIPCMDFEMLNFCKLNMELKEMGINLLIPSESQLRLRLKFGLNEFCQKYGIKAPKTLVVVEPDQLKVAVKEMGFPIVIKGLLHDSYFAHSLEEASLYYDKIRANWGLPVITQEYVKGEEYTMVALGNRVGKIVGAVTMKKLRVTEKGNTWAGITIQDDELFIQANNIFEKLRWVGPLEIEFIKRSSSKEYYLVEINPRFPSYVYLAAKAGQNLPLATVQLAMGKEIAPFTSFQAGAMFARHVTDLICPIEYLEDLVTKGELVFNGKTSTKFKKAVVAHD